MGRINLMRVIPLIACHLYGSKNRQNNMLMASETKKINHRPEKTNRLILVQVRSDSKKKNDILEIQGVFFIM